MEESLGDFGKLPAELRILIWEDLLSSGSPAILRTNKAIFNDIAGRLYDTLQIHISPSYADSWLQLQCNRLRVSRHLSKLELKKKFDKFQDLPWGSLKLVVYVYAPDPNDPGQIILLWQRLQDLVLILRYAGSQPSQITVRLKTHHNHPWEQEGTINESIKYPGDTLPDFLIAFLPFCRLDGVHDVQVTTDSCTLHESPSWALLTRCCNYIINDQEKEDNGLEFTIPIPAFSNIKALRIDTGFFLDTHLDTIPGPTANMLRRDRFAEWFTSGSFYGDEFSATLREHPYIIPMHDPHLRQWWIRCERYHMIVINTVLDDFRLGHPVTDGTFWNRIYPNGLRAFTEDWD
ncbi:hypothetical protein BO94DRAFT_460778 [Aspergillus sclerotioniger CBS 115572]|uniref:Uncharacterized protein n=1 Tax=Aspergillus sclerotioniger CBS 115572 TaxID=1450535 RepID=A0A317X318_9EURO|nr:hypothetical protein BO94DRAFT_460778 [Aspergillus sclerotioniger CBS 115572]PWY93019.1 hypothetical protein BO94DRAFT_460778 [Aspergillus sclerotioniger CBS 115572]